MTEISCGTSVVNGLAVFYRAAGPPDAPALLLLPDFPLTSRMYEPPLQRLASAYPVPSFQTVAAANDRWR